MTARPHPGRALPAYLVLVLAVAVLAVAGYAGYALYPRFDLPRSTGIGLVVLSTAAGIASFFSPCAFGLLLTLLPGSAGRSQPLIQAGSARRAAGLGAALALGALAFTIVAGGTLALGAGGLFARVTFTSTAGITVRTITGALLVILGLVQLGFVRADRMGNVALVARPLIERAFSFRDRRPTASLALLGFGYLLAGFG